MWIVTKPTQDYIGPSESCVLSWTPKQKKDSAFKKGFCLFLVYLKEEGIDHIINDHKGIRLPVQECECSENYQKTAAFYLHYESQFEDDQSITFSIIDFPL